MARYIPDFKVKGMGTSLFKYIKDYNWKIIPIKAEAAIYTIGCFLYFFNVIYTTTASIRHFQLNKSKTAPVSWNTSSLNKVIFATPIPAAAISAVDAGRRP